MNRYVVYLKYVIRHKYYVMIECFKLGLYWRGIAHDWSKFRLSEFVPYAKHFYNRDGTPIPYNRKRYDAQFNKAWLLHQKRNKHHWQYWVLNEDSGNTLLLPMPYECILEMYADWKGMSRTLKTTGVEDWYNKNKDKMKLHENTRIVLQCLMEEENV